MASSSSLASFSYVEFGHHKGDHLYFLGGFPDDNISGWSPLYEILKHKYNIISICFPHYSKGCQYKKWGYTFNELITMFDDLIMQLTTTTSQTSISSSSGGPSITLICHDWGAIIGLLYAEKYPTKVRQLILIDVGIKSRNETKLWELFLIILYQWWYSIAYIIGQLFGVPLGNCIFVTYMIFVTLFPFLKVCPNDTFHRPASEMTIEMCYIYFHYWKSFLQGKPIEPKYPSCPILYMVCMSVQSYISFFPLIFSSMEHKKMRCFIVKVF